MPASGKSTIGVVLAKLTGYDFIDTDILIQKLRDSKLETIIAEEGIEGFLDIESGVCCSLDIADTVLATGGSVIYRHKTMQHLRTLGTIVYLRVGIENLNSRLSDIKQRGVVLKEGQTLEDLFFERAGLYEKYADIVIDENELGLEETVELVSDKVRAFLAADGPAAGE